jgi:kumamolisin
MIVPGIHPYYKPRAVHEPEAWTVPALCKHYQWPTDAPGRGVIAIVELGGGYYESDVTAAFEADGLPVPKITNISVDSTTNTPGQSDDDYEVALDIQIAAASFSVATGEPATIRVYWSQDIAAAVTAASADGCDVCSISWGADEATWGRAAGDEIETAARNATQSGMVVFAASGDNDSSDGGPTPANVDLPASGPWVVGCGGTSLPLSGGPETVWGSTNPDGSGTGGGYSTLFSTEPWQLGIPPAPHGLGRMVPDLAAQADPAVGINIVYQGVTMPIGGTSCVAPLMAGLFASFGTKLGHVNPVLWASQSDFLDITVGDNGTYSAGPGPDACSGIGRPIGADVARLFVKGAV